MGRLGTNRPRIAVVDCERLEPVVANVLDEKCGIGASHLKLCVSSSFYYLSGRISMNLFCQMPA
jgi:hypothetical protein